MTPIKNFDQFVGIDWSGAKTPINTKSIAVASCMNNQDAPDFHPNIRSRTAVFEYIQSLIKKNHRTIIGIDCNFGIAQTIGQKITNDTRYTYRDLWALVEDTSKQYPNYYAGGLWRHYPQYFWTHGKMPNGFTMPKRLTETASITGGYGTPESPFKLIGAKQVGKGGFAGMRLAQGLKNCYEKKIAIWPFDPDSHYNQAQIIITEIFPRQFIKRINMGNNKIRTTDTLNTALNKFGSHPISLETITDHDSDAIITAAGLRYLCGNKTYLPERLTTPSPENTKILQREGWIFGVGYEP